MQLRLISGSQSLHMCPYSSHGITSHLTAANIVLQYHEFTANFQLNFSSCGSTSIYDLLTGYVDSDWANVSTNHWSLGSDNLHLRTGAVSWRPLKQDLTTISAFKVEYITFHEDSHDVQKLLQLFRVLCSTDASQLVINHDNQGALSHITLGIINAPSKHIDVCYYNSLDLLAHQIVHKSYIHTNENVANRLTRASQESSIRNSHRWSGDGN